MDELPNRTSMKQGAIARSSLEKQAKRVAEKQLS
jgi:hypothetical protein